MQFLLDQYRSGAPRKGQVLKISSSLNWIAEYHGPSPWAPEPVLVAELHMQEQLEPEWVTHSVSQLWALSGLTRTAPAEPPLSNTDAGLQLAREACFWSLAVLNEVRGDLHHAGAVRENGQIKVWLAFHHAPLSQAVLQLAVQALLYLMDGQMSASALADPLERLWNATRLHHPDFQARILRIACRQSQVPVLPFLPGTRYIQYGWGARSRVFFETLSNADGAVGQNWQKNKVLSKKLMASLGFPVAPHALIQRPEDLQQAVKAVGFPCVLKPIDGGGGKGVVADIRSPQALQAAWRLAQPHARSGLMLERHVAGVDYRLMVVDGRLVAVIERKASSLMGDGRHTVEQLLAALNATRSSNLSRSRYLVPIATDQVLLDHLRSQSLGLQDVPPAGQEVSLRSNANRSTGGVCVDVTHKVHPQLVGMAEHLARVTGLYAAGLDYITTDISQAPEISGGVFIEINATPGMAVLVAAGWSEAAIGAVLLGSVPGRIPVYLKVVEAAQISRQQQVLAASEQSPSQAWVCEDELCIGATRYRCSQTEPWAAFRAALRNPLVEQVQLVCSGQTLQRWGLPADAFAEVVIEAPTLESSWVTLARTLERCEPAS